MGRSGYPHPGARADPAVMWRLARRLWADHRPDAYGWCVTCRHEWHPCPAARLAALGLHAARGSAGAVWAVRVAGSGAGRAAWLEVLRRRVAAGELDVTDVVGEAVWLSRRRRGRRRPG